MTLATKGLKFGISMICAISLSTFHRTLAANNTALTLTSSAGYNQNPW
ncbi:hypothetical protein JCM19238_186 [Vibrio ponticus]|nr:hypothetical protein JCM19238_186 [Vibrio ponticus]